MRIFLFFDKRLLFRYVTFKFVSQLVLTMIIDKKRRSKQRDTVYDLNNFEHVH
jgi:hypothetical protein